MKKIIYLFFAVTFVFTCSNAFSQISVVMKALNGTTKLNGGSTVPGHTGEIDILSYSFGTSFCVGCVKTNFSDLTVMLSLNAATISLKKLQVNGTKLTSVDLTYIKTTTAAVEFYKVHMENVTIESIQESGSNEIPTYSVSFFPDKIAWQNTIIKGDGTAGAKSSYGWDVVNNAEWLYAF
jgi:type VI protein secretion system component Hcp